MAKDSWLTVNPMAGEGDATLTNSGTIHKGRLERQTVVTAVVKGIEAAKSYQVKQEPTAEYITLDKTSFEVGEGASTITVSGKSNSPKITFALGSGNDIPIVLPANYTANGLLTVNGTSIPDDPGAVDEFIFSAQIPIPKNTVGRRTGKITVTGSIASAVGTVTVTQATSTWTVTYSKGDYINTINKTSEKINWGNTATAVATLLADTAQYSYSFLGWYEGDTRISSSLSLSVANITANRTFTAIGSRTLNRYSLAFTITPTGAGTVSGGGTYDYGSSIKSTATPATGYNFTKWVDEEGVESTTNPYPGWAITKNRTIQAVFTIKSYAINLAAQYRVAESGDFTSGTTGGTVSGGGTFNHGTSVTAKATPATGYSFAGWYEGTSKVSDSASYTFTATRARSLTARFQRQWFTVTFTAGTGGSVSPTTARVQYGGEASSTATASTGYTFSRWSNGTKTAKLTVTNVTANATYTAEYTTNTYTVTYVKGTGIATISKTSETVSWGANATGCTATVTTGYTFDGWYNGSTRVSTSLTYAPTAVKSNLSLTAKANINSYTVSPSAYYRTTDGTGNYTAGTTGGTVSGGGSVNHGGSITVTASAAAGYKFDGWYSAGASGGTLLSSSASYAISGVTASMTVYARFTRIYYTITYSAGDYVASLSRTTERVAHGANAAGSTMTVNGTTAQYSYGVDGWYSGSTRVTSSATYAPTGVTANATYTAIGSRTLNRYSLAFTITPTGAGTVSGGGTYDYGSSIKSTATPATGYNFTKWVDEEGVESTTNPYPGWAITKNRTIQAVFTIKSYAINLAAQYRVAESGDFTSGTTGGTVSGGGTFNHGTSVTAKATPATGYSFAGWYEGTSKVSDSASYTFTATRARSLTARFQRQWFTVTFTAGTGGSVSPTTARVQYGGEASSTATASTGYTFSRWSNGTKTAKLTVTNVTANATYTAEYTTNTYTVTYVKGTGIATISKTSETVSWGANATGCTATVTTGYTFDGWYNGSTRVSTSLTYAPTAVKSNLSLTAKANINSYTVSPSAYYRTTDGTGNYTAGTTGGTVSGGGSVNHGGSITVTASAAAGYKFDGWYSAGASGGTLLSSSASYAISGVTASMTVYARFTRIYYTITYSAGDYVASLSRTTERVAHGANAAGSTMTVNGTTAQYSYGVDGWYSGSTRVTSSATYAPTGVTANATYTAKGTRSLRSYTVTYNKGSYISSVSRASESVSYGSNAAGSTATVMASDAQYTYGFDGWYNGSTRVSTSVTYAPTNITGAVTLEARGTRTTKSYTISVSLDSSAAGRGSVSGGGSYAYGASATVKCTKTNSQDVFDGWYEGSTRVSTSLSYTFTVTGARTLVAKILYLDVTPTSLSYGATGGSQTFKITTNTSWKIS
jgi:uncharacterized repeat protein (TIGR02543 family)